MSTIGSFNAAAGPTGLLGMLVNNSDKIKAQLDQYTEQSSTGLVSQTYGGLGSAASISLNLRPQLATTAIYSQNITVASTVVSTSSQVITQLQQIATTFLTGTLNYSAQTSGAIDTMATQAKTALAQVQSLMNTQLGQSYIFAGQDSANAPMPDTAFNAYVSNIQTVTQNGLAAEAAGGPPAPPATAGLTLTAATSPNSPFSSTLVGTATQTTSIGFGVTVPVGIVAGQNSYSTQTGTSTTGSYVRDLIRSLATISALKGSDITNTAQIASFTALVADTRTSLTDQSTAMNQEAAGLGGSQQTLTSNQTTLTDTQTSLTQQISAVENVDVAATSTALTQAQTQLQISYKLIASMQSLSLVQYLPT